MSKLAKPQFVKLNTLVDARNGYNVYVKVVKAEQAKSNDGLTTFVRAVVADETGSANAYFKGETVPLIKEGAVIAIRNGTIRLIKNHISLEIDIFGRVTPQTVQIKQNTKDNISDKEIERRKKERRNYDDRQQYRPRRPRDEREQREPREHREHRQPREPRQQREPKQQRQQREPREQREQREPRQPREQREQREPRQRRQPRQQREQREPRQRRQPREQREQREPREHREPRQQREPRERRQFREGAPRRENEERRPPINWTKIAGIDPGEEGLNIIAKVVSVENVGKKARVVLGDETGIVKAFLYQNEALVEGNTVVLFRACSTVVKQHIQIQLMDRGKVDVARREIKDVNRNHDVSAKEWVEQS